MLKLVLVNLFRNKLRTILTLLSVFVALFLFSSLGAILDTLQAASDAGSRELIGNHRSQSADSTDEYGRLFQLLLSGAAETFDVQLPRIDLCFFFGERG